MIGTWLTLLSLGCLAWAWFDASGAREQAIRHGHELCQAAGVQLLDQTVSMKRVRMAWRDGFPTLVRRYAFDVSMNGHDRHRGHLDLAGRRLETWSLPLADAVAASVVPEHVRVLQ